MKWIIPLKQYPAPLWALTLYLCSLGFYTRHDWPLAVLVVSCIFGLGGSEYSGGFVRWLHRHWPVFLFLVATLWVTATSRNIGHSLQVQVHLLPALLIYLTMMQFIEVDRYRLFILASLIFAGLVAEVSFLIQAISLTEIPDRLEKIWAIRSPLLIAPNDVLFFAVWAPVGAYLVDTRQPGLVRILGVLYLVFTLILAVYMQSRQAVGVYLGGLFLMGYFWRPVFGISTMLIGVATVLVIDLLTGKALLSKLIYLFPRRYVWEAAWQMFLERPWVGHGPGMFNSLYVEYLEKAGYALEGLEDRRPMRWAHSLYLEQLAERGLVGLMALLVLIGTCLRALIAQLTSAGGQGRAILAAWCGYLVAGIAELSLLRIWTVVSLLMLFSLTRGILYNKKE